MKDPLEPDGFAFATASIKAFTFSISYFHQTMLCQYLRERHHSALNWTSPPLAAFTASVTSTVTVPTFGLGIRLRGLTYPDALQQASCQALLYNGQNLLYPIVTSIKSSAPTISAPASFASCAFASLAKPLPSYSYQYHLAGRQHLAPFDCMTCINPKVHYVSIVSSNLAVALDFTSLTASSIVTSLFPLKALRFWFFYLSFPST